MANLPSGTVTFLFTDIEGSTQLWERDRAAMATAVERHVALLRTAIEANGGVLFKTIGDAVQAAFPTAPQALAAAFDAQRALITADWVATGPLLIRMALHAGDAQPHDSDYLAAPLNRLSRLLSAAHGGQILLTQSVQQLARGALPETSRLRDLGEHRLRDLLEPERIFQLLHPELPDAFPALRTLETHPHNLPIQLTPLLGRDEDVAAICACVAEYGARLVTLTGPGGTGKTRLALAVAAELLDDFPDGVWFVDLAPLNDPALVLPTVARTLGLREGSDQSLAEVVSGYLAAKRLVIVLDNYEHLLRAVPVISDLLRAGPAIVLLVTSREPLHLRGEQEVAISPLPLPEQRHHTRAVLAQNPAVALFVQRAQSAKRDFALTDENARSIAAICRQLDGLPLAIELAAARVKVLPPASLLARLESRLPLLAGGPRDAPARQRALRDTIAWSHDLLTPEEQTLFRRLGVFAGGWTLDAAEAVTNAGGELDVLEVTASLLDKNLVGMVDQSHDEPRFTMLGTIREFAVEQLLQDASEADRIRQSHAAWCLALATAVTPRPNVTSEPTNLESSLERLSTDYDNLRAALAWFSDRGDGEALARLTGTLSWFWHWTAYGREGLAWTERALTLRAGVSPQAHMELLAGTAVFLARMGDHARATALSEELLAVAREAQNQEGEASAWFLLSRAANQRGANADAMTLAEKSVALFRKLDATSWLPWALQRLGIEWDITGDHERAAALQSEALERFRAAGNTLGIAYALRRLGLTLYHLGDRRKAMELYQESLILHRAMADPWETASLLGQLAALVGEYGHAEQVARLLGAAHGLYQSSGTSPQPYFREALDAAEAQARTGLEPDAYTVAWEGGQRLSLGQAIEEGLTAVLVIKEDLAGADGRKA
jgi:predicted ATPase/class 3 adenylate cyclase